MRWLTVGLVALVLAGCGQKGPLYLPDDKAAQERYGTGEAREDTRDADQDEN